MKLRIWTLVTALMIIAAFGLALPSMLSDQTAAVAINYEQVKSDFKDEFIQSIAALNYKEETTQAPNIAPTNTDKPLDTAPITNNGKQDKTEKLIADAGKNSASASDNIPTDSNAASEDVTDITDGQTPLGGGTAVVKDGWINEKINKNRDKISDADLSRGAAIYNTLDTDFLFGLADEGLTPEERAQVDTYLRSQLSGSDYELAKQLYSKYVGLLNND